MKIIIEAMPTGKGIKHIDESEEITNSMTGMLRMHGYIVNRCAITSHPNDHNHMSVIRSWIQHHAHNGSTVTWGSDEFLNLKPVTVRELEALATKIKEAVG